jgi:S-adenosylmethionine decarboxylase
VVNLEKSDPMNGLHLTADLKQCNPLCAALTQVQVLREHCLTAVTSAQLHAVGEVFHQFATNGGITGVVLLAESHLAIHTWPELQAVTLDVYVCNFGTDNTAKAHALMNALVSVFNAQNISHHALERGQQN